MQECYNAIIVFALFYKLSYHLTLIPIAYKKNFLIPLYYLTLLILV